MHWLETWLHSSAIARLFVVIAAGYLLGELKLFGNFRLGVVAVLFVGIGTGAWHPEYRLPDELQTLGLVLFVYCMGLQVSAGFLGNLRREGLRLNLAVLISLLGAVGVCAWLIKTHAGPAQLIAGIFCGALSNTAALGAATEALTRAGADPAAINQAVVGYGIGYPLSVVIVLLLIQLRAALAGPSERIIATPAALPLPITIEITKLDGHGAPRPARALGQQLGIIFTRFRDTDGKTRLVAADTLLTPGTLVIAVGEPSRLREATELLGHKSEYSFHDDLTGFGRHRYFVSNPAIVGRPLRELDLLSLGGIVTRLRRGDVDLPVTSESQLHLGDRVRVISASDRESDVRAFFGNSLTRLTETGYLSFALGIVLGLLIGQLPIPVPGLDSPIRLGAAGGALLASLILGNFGRSGPFIWHLPYDVNLSLRQFGILLFLASVGLKAGGGIGGVLEANGGFIVSAACVIALVSTMLTFGCLRLFGKRGLPEVLGVLCGVQTQPAALGFAAARTDTGRLHTAYAAVYPLALIGKIILVQIILLM